VETATFEPHSIDLKYNTNGNLTNDGVRSYTYDAENRLIEIQNQQSKIINSYDGLGRKVTTSEMTSGSGGAPATLRQIDFIYDGWNVVLDFSPDEIENSYIWGLDLSGTLQGAGGVGGLLAVESPFEGGTGGCYFYCYDGNGNVINLINIDTKEIAAHYEYDPFGRLLEKEGSYADRNFYRFSTKKRVSPFFGIYYYGYRWYDPDFARWLTKDPIGENGGLNLYGFVRNNPVENFDALGLKTTKAAGAKEIRGALPKIKALCKKCCKHVPSIKKCERDAKIIIEKLAKFWEEKYGRGPYGGKSGNAGDCVGGYFCWDWASGFKNTVNKVSSTIWAATFRRFAAAPNSDGSTPVHYAAKIRIKKAKDKKCQWNIDDGFFEDGLIHDSEWPKRKDYKEDIKNPIPRGRVLL